MRLKGLLVLAIALAAPAARADEMCDALDKVWAAAPTFESLRGEYDGVGSWKATVSLPGAKDCRVIGITDGTFIYGCRPLLEGDSVEAPSVKAYGARVAACSPRAVPAFLKDAFYVYFGHSQRIELLVWPEFEDKYRLLVYP